MAEKNICEGTFTDIAYTLGYASVDEAISYLKKLSERLFDENEVILDEEDIDILVKSVNPERLKNNPLPLTDEMICKVYENIMNGSF